MFRSILPKEVGFFDLFEAHASVCLKASRELSALLSGDGSAAQHAARIREFEREADDITHKCTDALHRTFITPFDRSDIHKLIQRLDDVVDSAESIASRIVLYDITEMKPEAQALGELLVRAGEEITEAVRGLRDMKHPESIKTHCVVLFELENQADTVMRAALANLFRQEKDVINLVKWKEIFERLEYASDRCEAVASIVQGIVIEAS